jgi:uncharacterized membrane protein
MLYTPGNLPAWQLGSLVNEGSVMAVPRNNVGDSKARSLVKAISWRAVAFLVLGTISYLITGNWAETTGIAIVYTVVQIFIYFAHERLWDGIAWGKPDALDQLPHTRELNPDEIEMITGRLKDLGYIE